MPLSQRTVRHETTIRRLTVASVQRVVPSIVRVTLTGPALTGFTSPGPADHVKLFLPDAETGVLATPALGGETTGMGKVIARDYTPLAFRAAIGDTPAELDIDLVIHGEEGPASAWAAAAQPGQEVAIGGPRGSRLVPEGLRRLIVVADETALPATARWLALTPPEVPVTALLDVADPETEGYLAAAPADGAELLWHHGHDAAALEATLRSLAPFDEDTFLFLAGEATALVPLRRYLRRELGLPKEQVWASGYWKRGVVALDHHAPLDVDDPD